MKNLVILGSTGSIGRQTLDIVRAFPQEFKVIGLAAGHNTKLLSKQIQEFKPKHIYSLATTNVPTSEASFTSLSEMASIPEVDIVIVATTGSAGLIPTLNALKEGKSVALSNKEPIVMAGHLIKLYESLYGGRILPVDSEPSAIWQCIQGEDNEIRRLIITASGGPFREWDTSELDSVTPSQALNHPTWAMGEKITIDSATLMNKAFEVIESHWLFNVDWNSIKVMIHPQSTIHSMVEFQDGSVKAQLGPPDMRLPIQYALFYPNRLSNELIPKLDTNNVYSFDLKPLNPDRYPCFELALTTAKNGGTFPTILSSADEVAVNAFLKGKLSFTQIPNLIERVINEHQPSSGTDISEIIEADTWATNRSLQILEEHY
ncbi:MAG: 1-deoxy-D-xylulose-5-phosphate reductoisomerase [Pseudomonadales bacterium]|nr:1-deoxy-D-xylulose-5-phosphate reductoisomerase [Pseudomonadales bacterium]